MKQSLKEQVMVHVRDAMGDFPTPHLLDWHTGIFMELIQAQRQSDLEKISFHAGIDLKTLQGYLESNIEPNKETEQD